MRKIAPFLSDKGWEVTVYGRPGAIFAEDPIRDIRVQSVQTRGFEKKSISTLTFGLSASLDAWRRRPDVALIMNVANGFFLPLYKLRGISTLVNVDGMEWERDKWGALAKFVFRAGAHMTAKFADQLIFDSHEISKRWKQEFARDGVYIPYGGEPWTELPLEPGLEHRGYILFVARFVPENTILEFLEATRKLAENWPIVIVGSSGYGGSIEKEIRTLTKTRKNVRWLGHISDDRRLLALWQHAGVYFHGHSVGGTNPTLVQAMALGVPTAARDTVYNREVLPDGAVFFDPSPESITKALTSLLNDKAKQDTAGRENSIRARKFYTWEQVCKAYLDELKALAGSRSK